MARRASYRRDNVPCTGKRVYVEAKGLMMGAADLDGQCCILITLKQTAPRNKWEREFVYWCGKLDIQVRACVKGAEAGFPTREGVAAAVSETGSAVFEAYGSPEALDQLRTLPCIEKWEWMMSGAPSVRISVQGAGPEKQRPTKPKVKPVIYPTDSKDLMEKRGPLPVAGTQAELDVYQEGRGFQPIEK